MFASVPLGGDQALTLYAIGVFLVVAPVALIVASVAGYLHRESPARE